MNFYEKYPKFYLTQTSTKDLEKDETCPSRWRAQWLEGLIPFASSEDMDKGKFFEQICLGSSAVGGEEPITDLPRVYGGRKSIDQLRIEEQAARFKRFFTPTSPEFQGQVIEAAQVELKDEANRTKGTIDFVTLEVNTGDIWINDLKLTKDVNNTRTKYGWGNEWSEMDMLQMVHYSDLYELRYKVRPRVALWVFDYSSAKRVKLGEIRISNKARTHKEIRLAAANDVIHAYDVEGWAYVPSESECRGCPLECSRRFVAGEFEKIIVNI